MDEFRFSKNEGFDFEVRCTLGLAPSGAADVGEVLAAVYGVKPKDDAGWFAAWLALAERTAATADQAAAKGRETTAAWASLRAASYYAVALNAASALDDVERLDTTFAAHRKAWDAFVTRSPLPVQPVAIPYEDGDLPGWLFSPAGATGPRPTVIMNNGSDGPISAMWGEGGADALARGYNTLFFDGPGQQSMLFERGVPFRHDWEAVITPVVDFLATREEVDAAKIALFGISQAGYWVPRAIAFEHRLVAAIADPGVVDVSTSWEEHVPKSMLKLLENGEREKFDRDMRLGMKLQHGVERIWKFRARPYGTEGYYDTMKAIERQSIDAETAAQIKTPLLITSPEREQFWPGQSEQLAAMTPDVSTLVNFTAAEGADWHCQPLARTLTHERVYDWLDEVLAA